jgi:hypothetical protein
MNRERRGSSQWTEGGNTRSSRIGVWTDTFSTRMSHDVGLRDQRKRAPRHWPDPFVGLSPNTLQPPTSSSVGSSRFHVGSHRRAHDHYLPKSQRRHLAPAPLSRPHRLYPEQKCCRLVNRQSHPEFCICGLVRRSPRSQYHPLSEPSRRSLQERLVLDTR